MYISCIVLCDIYIMKLMYVYVQTLIMLLRLGMHTKYINKNKNKFKKNTAPVRKHCEDGYFSQNYIQMNIMKRAEADLAVPLTHNSRHASKHRRQKVIEWLRELHKVPNHYCKASSEYM